MITVRVTTPTPDGTPLVSIFRALTRSRRKALRWIRANPKVLPQASVEIVPNFYKIAVLQTY